VQNTAANDANTSVAPTKAAPVETATKLQAILQDHNAATPEIAGEAMYVQTPTWTWAGATGKVAGKNEALTPGHVFRIASVTKPFTAAAILRLMEQGRFDITNSIQSYISSESAALLRKGGYDPTKITIQQLLSHTSGIYDYAGDPKFSEIVLENPSRQWTRAEQIEHAMLYGKPYGAPGDVYGYSDTGYILLGEIVERQVGKNLGQSVRSLINFEKIGLTNTYWEQFEPKTKAPFAGNIIETADLTQANHSLDLFGGGGLISTNKDLATFFRALIRGQVFENQSTLAIMLTVPNAKRSTDDIRTIEGNGIILQTIGRYRCLGHSGFWGIFSFYCPENDISVSYSFNRAGKESTAVNFDDRLATALNMK
jgi:D-alanyl-D-alanine carboxypeptidase